MWKDVELYKAEQQQVSSADQKPRFKSLKWFEKRKLVYTKADNCDTVVVMDKAEYKEKVPEMLKTVLMKN